MAFVGKDVLPVVADVTDAVAVDHAVALAVETFGGLDLLVSNAGSFPEATPLESLSDASWDATLALNLSAHQKLLRAAVPFLALGFDPAVVFVASKNVRAPGPGVAAYSVAKAGLTQLARVAAIELAPKGVRVNVVHPDAVFDTSLWTIEKIAQRAERYGLSAEQYRTRNLLGREIRSRDVANAVARLLSSELGATTGAQLPIDGGNDRTI
ncbi:MAG: SDR family oxidoreductase [Myxococcota bacterium]